jgi:primosomal protein DnaI
LKKEKKSSNIRGIYVYGSYGIGKTLMLHTFLNALQKEGFKCVFAKVSTLSKKLKSNFDKNNDINDEIIEMYKNCDILVFDDIGVSDVSE